jgi:thioester reductase-like protein
MAAETALLTGFPALRARYILDALLRERTDLSVVALVHEERFDEAEQRLGALDPASARRVSLCRGDAAAMDFGLSGAEYLALAERVDVVHAAYSITEPSASGEQCRRVNVGAARELVELGRARSKPLPIVWYSSVFVSGGRKGSVLESELEAGQSFRNQAERTLAIAERMLRKSQLPVVVLRAGHLVGATTTGEVDDLAGPYPLLLLLVSASEERPLPLPPGADAPLPLTPVDYLAAFGAFVGQSARSAAAVQEQGQVRTSARTVHVVGEDRVTLRRFLELAAERAGRRIDPGLNPTALTRVLIGNPVAKLLPQNARGILDVLTTAAEYDQKHLRELVESGAPPAPPLQSYLGPLVEHVRARIQDGTLVVERPPRAPWLIA